MNETIEQENKAAQEQLEKDKKEAAEFTKGVTGAGFDEKKPEDPPEKVEKKDEPEKLPPTEPEKKPDNSKDGEPQDPPDDPEKSKKHIPMDKYLDEKKEWKDKETAWETEKAEILAKNQELEKLANAKKDDPKIDEKIEAYANTHGIDKAQVKGLIELIQEGITPTKEDHEDPVAKSMKEKHLQQEEQTYFNNEFTQAEPTLKEFFPNATDDQKQKIKDKLWEVSHKKEFVDKDLDYIIFKNKKDLEEIVGATTPAEKPADGIRGIEAPKPGNGKNTILVAKDFVGKTDFSAMTNLSEEDQKRLVKDMDPETRLNWMRWADDQNSGLEVQRGGRIIRLK